MYDCATSKWHSGNPPWFATASTSFLDADDEQGEDGWV